METKEAANFTIVNQGMCPSSNTMENLLEKGGMTMTKLQILGLTALAVLMLAPDAWARGAVSGGMRGAAVGGMMGGSSGAATGAKIGVVTGAAQGAAQRSQDRNSMDAETQARAQYYTTPAYQNAQYSNYNEAPPEVM